MFFLVELAVDGAEDVFDFAAGYVGCETPAERDLVALAAIEIPLLYGAMQAADGEIGVFFAGIGHDYEKFVSTLAEDDVTAPKTGGEQAGKFSQHEVAFYVA